MPSAKHYTCHRTLQHSRQSFSYKYKMLSYSRHMAEKCSRRRGVLVREGFVMDRWLSECRELLYWQVSKKTIPLRPIPIKPVRWKVGETNRIESWCVLCVSVSVFVWRMNVIRFSVCQRIYIHMYALQVCTCQWGSRYPLMQYWSNNDMSLTPLYIMACY